MGKILIRLSLLLILAIAGYSHAQINYDELSIEALTARSYGGGTIQLVEVMQVTPNFTRFLIAYPSDDLTIYGFMNVPHVEGSLPVIIAIHGYVNPSVYGTLDYTTRYADALANAGYLVIHPNLRNYSPSDADPGDNLFRIGYAIDVLNLIGIVQEQGGQPGSLQQADPERMGLWGHSMGGGISIRVLTISPHIDAAILYGSMSADEVQNHQKIVEWSGGSSGHLELDTPSDILSTIAPINYLDRINAIVSIHHGENDTQVPLQWSLDLCRQLQTLEKLVECYMYDDQPHTFRGTRRSVVYGAQSGIL